MNTNIPPVIATQACVHCGALSQSKEGRCWLCFEDKMAPNPYAVPIGTQAEESLAARSTWNDVVFSILLSVCVLLTVLIGIGLAVEDQGLLIPFAILMLPAYAVMIIRGLVGVSRNQNLTPANYFVTFVVSLLVTVLISVLLIVAAAILLFLACIGAVGGFK